MERRLAFLSGNDEAVVQKLDLDTVEDIAYILLQLLKKEGYASPSVAGLIRFGDSSEESYIWSVPFAPLTDGITSGKAAESVQFRCDPGVQQYYRSVKIEGVAAIETASLQGFFIPSGVLLTRRKDKFFTLENLGSRTGRLLSALHSDGLADARVVKSEVQVDEDSGGVDVLLEIEEGPVHVAGDSFVEVYGTDGAIEAKLLSQASGAVLNTLYIREQRQALLNEYFRMGYPDAKVRVERRPGVPDGTNRLRVDLVFHLTLGDRVKLDSLVFLPEGVFHPSVLKRQSGIQSGEYFNLLEIEETRRQLLSLGVLEDVKVEYEVVDSANRKAIYTLVPSPRQRLSLQVGYGSYELGRAGLNWEHINMWGRAHRYEVGLKRSFKTWGITGAYIMPQFYSSRVTAFVRAGHEFREEVGYEWTKSSLVFGASRRLEMRGAEVSLEYGFENLDTTRESELKFDSLDRATVASLALRFTLDRRDSVLYPKSGYDLSTYLKVATDLIGGESNFELIEQSASYHKFLGRSLYLHLGLRYGTIFSKSPTSSNLPFNERFFLGGENSVRGYKRGEATSLTVDGDPIGSESYILANFEIEQRVYRDFSVVVFWDGIGLEESQSGFPNEEYLQSVGIGLRWRTPAGPIRLEYGHNLDPREADPEGTLHFSVGFPF